MALSERQTEISSWRKLKKGTKISVFWTEMQQWFTGTVTSSRLETGDDGQTQRATHIQYDKVGAWRTTKQLSHWHCLDDECWQPADDEGC